MDRWAEILKRAAGFSAEVVAETLWPTRCALCDAPGTVLCAACERELAFLDWWTACPRCGAAFGKVQCDLCNPVSLARIGYEELPFAGCASATLFDEETTGRIVRIYKDQGERRLAGELAERMCRYVAPHWDIDAVTFVPATKAAVRYRGFDHAELLAREVAVRLELPLSKILDRPKTSDQRALGASQRIANLTSSFTSLADMHSPRGMLLVDDVFTTGATLCAATDALRATGAARVYCLTFARV